jgi:hypothetical protein
MSNKIQNICVTFIVVFFTGIHFANAGFEITEIMYDLDGTDTNREWVEVHNTGAEPADLSKWFFFSDNSKHALTPQGVSLVPAGGYAVIVQDANKFKTDWPNYSLLLFDSSWTGFNNEGETIALKDPGLNVVGEVTFTSSQGASGNGDSLQKLNNSWGGAIPTPGVENQSTSSSGGDGGVSSGSSTTTSSTSTPVIPISKKKEIEVPKITTNILASNTVFAGIPFEIDAVTTGYGKEPLKMGRFVWNFGDGMTKAEYEHKPFEHVYQYPGEYVVTLSYYRAFEAKDVDATDRVTIKVVPSGISISSVGTVTDPFIEIENKSTFEVDLSGWVLKGSVQSFYIPEGTIILPSQKLRFSGKATSFNLNDLQSINLQNTNDEIAASYPSKAKSSTQIASSSRSYSSGSNLKSNSPEVINLSDLGASAGGPDTKISISNYAFMGLIGVIIIGLASVYLVRKKKVSDAGIEKEISAEDIKIME